MHERMYKGIVVVHIAYVGKSADMLSDNKKIYL